MRLPRGSEAEWPTFKGFALWWSRGLRGRGAGLSSSSQSHGWRLCWSRWPISWWHRHRCLHGGSSRSRGGGGRGSCWRAGSGAGCYSHTSALLKANRDEPQQSQQSVGQQLTASHHRVTKHGHQLTQCRAVVVTAKCLWVHQQAGSATVSPLHAFALASKGGPIQPQKQRPKVWFRTANVRCRWRCCWFVGAGQTGTGGPAGCRLGLGPGASRWCGSDCHPLLTVFVLFGIAGWYLLDLGSGEEVVGKDLGQGDESVQHMTTNNRGRLGVDVHTVSLRWWSRRLFTARHTLNLKDIGTATERRLQADGEPGARAASGVTARPAWPCGTRLQRRGKHRLLLLPLAALAAFLRGGHWPAPAGRCLGASVSSGRLLLIPVWVAFRRPLQDGQQSTQDPGPGGAVVAQVAQDAEQPGGVQLGLVHEQQHQQACQRLMVQQVAPSQPGNGQSTTVAGTWALTAETKGPARAWQRGNTSGSYGISCPQASVQTCSPNQSQSQPVEISCSTTVQPAWKWLHFDLKDWNHWHSDPNQHTSGQCLFLLQLCRKWESYFLFCHLSQHKLWEMGRCGLVGWGWNRVRGETVGGNLRKWIE